MNNTVILVGNIVRNIELRMTTSGKNICNVMLAVKRNYKNSNNEYETDFISCKAFGTTAEFISNYCKKGDTIGIRGNILTGSYEKDGEKVYTTDIMIESISFFKRAKEKEEVKEEPKEEPSIFDKNIEEFSNETDFSDLPF